MDQGLAQHLPQDIWKVVAGFLVEKNTFRTVYDVAQDLFSLQLACKGSSKCATSVWPSVVRACAKPHLKVARSARMSADVLREHLAKRNAVPASYVLEEAAQLPVDQLTVFLQVQSDKHAQINHKNARHLFGLSNSDLAAVQRPTFTSLKGTPYLKQAVIAAANRKWGSLKAFQQHQAVWEQQQDTDRHSEATEACPKRQCIADQAYHERAWQCFDTQTEWSPAPDLDESGGCWPQVDNWALYTDDPEQTYSFASACE